MQRAGFTMIELLVALMLLALLVATAGPLSVQAMRGGIRSEKQATAIALAEDGLECIKRQAADMASSDPLSVLTGLCNPNGPAGFTLASVVDPDPAGYDDGVGHVTVTVSWGTGDSESVTLQALLAGVDF